MNSDDIRVDKLFLERLAKRLRALEEQRRATASKLTLAIVVVTVLAVVIGPWAFHFHAKLGLFAVIAWLSACGGLYKWLTADFVKTYKENAITRLVEHLGDGLAYQAAGTIPQAEFEKSGLFPGNITSYQGEDLVQGRIHGCDVRFCELRVHQRFRFGILRDERTLRLLFLEATLPAAVRGHVQLASSKRDDFLQKLEGKVGLGVKALPPRVDIKDTTFAAHFSVRAKQAQAAHDLLTPIVRRRLMALGERVDGEVHLAFVGSKLYLAISVSKNLFEPTIMTPVSAVEPLKEHLEKLRLMLGILDDLLSGQEKPAAT